MKRESCHSGVAEAFKNIQIKTKVASTDFFSSIRLIVLLFTYKAKYKFAYKIKI